MTLAYLYHKFVKGNGAETNILRTNSVNKLVQMDGKTERDANKLLDRLDKTMTIENPQFIAAQESPAFRLVILSFASVEIAKDQDRK